MCFHMPLPHFLSHTHTCHLFMEQLSSLKPLHGAKKIESHCTEVMEQPQRGDSNTLSVDCNANIDVKTHQYTVAAHVVGWCKSRFKRWSIKALDSPPDPFHHSPLQALHRHYVTTKWLMQSTIKQGHCDNVCTLICSPPTCLGSSACFMSLIKHFQHYHHHLATQI